VSGAPLAIAFFDPARDLYGTARSGATLLFEGRRPTVIAQGPVVKSTADGLRAEVPGRLTLELEPLSPAADLGDVSTRIYRARGDVGGQSVDCLGTVSETKHAPAWDELDLLRSVSVLADDGHAFVALAKRPRGVGGHGDEQVTGWVFEDGQLLPVEDTRISTVYDGSGRQRSAGLELWVQDEEFARRGAGAALAGSSLELESLSVHAAVFRWRLDGREAIGSYELMVRADPPVAA
jgi:hypothetical protein